MKKLTFKNGIYTIHIPFILMSQFSWQEQVRNEMNKMKVRYKVRKSARWGFSITENGAEINIYKN